MHKANLISLLALLVFILALPLYALNEPARLQLAQASLRQEFVNEGAGLYVDYCALCHGPAGEGLGVMPALNHPALAGADHDSLFRTIARAAHGSTMAAWHIEEGGVLNDYQIEEIVALIRFADWNQVAAVAQARDFAPPPQPAAELGLAFLETEDLADPHMCVACHEEPLIHAERFGVNCARCHSTVAWTPALLTKHNFALDHGGAGQVDCVTCHIDNYYTNSCYECHDHDPDEMRTVHLAENLPDYAACSDCHPTGAAGEAEQIMQQRPPGETASEVDQANLENPFTALISSPPGTGN